MIFGGIGERLEFIHRADSRDTFRPRRSPRRLVGGQAQDVRGLYIGFISTVLNQLEILHFCQPSEGIRLCQIIVAAISFLIYNTSL